VRLRRFRDGRRGETDSWFEDRRRVEDVVAALACDENGARLHVVLVHAER
jgi:hypothetical protein